MVVTPRYLEVLGVGHGVVGPPHPAGHPVGHQAVYGVVAPGEEEEEDAGGGGEEGEPVEGAPGGRGVAAGDQVGQHQRHRVTREDVIPAELLGLPQAGGGEREYAKLED